MMCDTVRIPTILHSSNYWCEMVGPLLNLSLRASSLNWRSWSFVDPLRCQRYVEKTWFSWIFLLSPSLISTNRPLSKSLSWEIWRTLCNLSIFMNSKKALQEAIHILQFRCDDNTVSKTEYSFIIKTCNNFLRIFVPQKLYFLLIFSTKYASFNQNHLTFGHNYSKQIILIKTIIWLSFYCHFLKTYVY